MAAAANQSYARSELLVKFKPAGGRVARLMLQESVGARESRAVGRSGIERVVLGPDTSVEQALAIYAGDPDVEFAEPNYLIQPQAMPDDAYFTRQWGLDNTGQTVAGYMGTPGIDMGMDRAWDITQGDPGVIVAVVDTGCDLTHPDLAANIWTNPGEIPGNGVDDDHNGYIDDVHGWDFVNNDPSPQDAVGHGTHVAGIIAAAGNNGIGVAGVAWRAGIMPLRFIDAFEIGTTADAIEAIQYALRQGARIINCSWGTSQRSRALEDVMDNADALFVTAAGNTSIDIDRDRFYPAGYNAANILSVAAGDQMGALAWFSNYGTANVDVVAPGIRIYSLDNGRTTFWSEDFDQGDLSHWQTGGRGNRWAAAQPSSGGNSLALASNPDGDDAADVDAWACLPPLDLSAASASMLRFNLTGNAPDNAATLHLEVSLDGNRWYDRPLKVGTAIHSAGISGSLPYWISAQADLGPWDGRPQVYLRFRFHSDGAAVGAGYYVDNLVLSAGAAMDTYQYMQGTSMAAGFVSGIAALILSREPDRTPLEVKSIITESVDLDGGLFEDTRFGGRVNAYNALTLLRNLSLTADKTDAGSVHLSWRSKEELSSDVVIERRADGDTEFSAIARVDAGASDYTDTEPSDGSMYCYRIQAQTRDGRSGYSNQSMALELGPNAPAGTGGGGGGGGGCFIDLLAGGR